MVDITQWQKDGPGMQRVVSGGVGGANMQDGKGPGTSLRAVGAYMTLFSFVGGCVVLFAFPGSAYVSAALIIILALTFIGGLITLALGLFFGWGGRRA